jgi:acyl-coenzyme A synthetase/AMP-(fatty) acid ligase
MVIDRIYEWARLQPDRTAVIYNDQAISYAAFARAIEATRKFLAGQHLPAGSTAALVIYHLIDCWITCIAARAIGLDTVALSDISKGAQLKLHQPCFVLVETELSAVRVPDSNNAKVIIVPQTIYTEIHGQDLPAPIETESLYGGHILYTSGTTGTDKKLLWRARDEERRVAARATCQGFDAGTVEQVLNIPMWTGAGFKRPLAVWTSGGCVVIDDSRERFTRFFQHGITHAFLTPLLLDQVISAARPRATNSPRPTLTVGGAASKKHQVIRAIEHFRSDLVVEYAATELMTPALSSTVRTADDAEWLSRHADREVSIVDDELRPVGPGQEGFIRIALNDGDFSSYYQGPGGRSAFDGGYFYPGDMAVQRADGRIRILGRVEDVINIEGQKLAVAPLEQDLQRHLEVDEVCLFGHVNDTGQEELIVAIRSSSGPPQAKLDHIRTELKSFDVVRFHVMDEFPRTDTGKVRRVVLKNLLVK